MMKKKSVIKELFDNTLDAMFKALALGASLLPTFYIIRWLLSDD